MSALLKGAVSELWGLFVDDGWLAGLVLAWIALAAAVLRGHPGSMRAGIPAAVFAAGVLVILAVSVLRAAGRARARRGPPRGAA
jgi:hypothetical protein